MTAHRTRAASLGLKTHGCLRKDCPDRLRAEMCPFSRENRCDRPWFASSYPSVNGAEANLLRSRFVGSLQSISILNASLPRGPAPPRFRFRLNASSFWKCGHANRQTLRRTDVARWDHSHPRALGFFI
ncbi:hypothetical protein RB12751 [Rhodopirellula baltica SH 1]|uniref:Uncharacterized protein n=1 Tax=Rhodopirellula baltica (strain DSM 10527 / NCIMB 13988 / SH1) TaxID=243090 RepID=Q7UI54_RHOBA|nr:hypothetical protein RB12751 [Rhodopirellula baltica SH 1]